MQHISKYRRLTNREREEISRFLAAGTSQAEIARRLNRHPSTLSREIRRNGGYRARSTYRAFSAGRRAQARASSRRRGKSRLAGEEGLRRFVLAGLKQEWSPKEIRERLKREYPLDMTMRISHEAIYRYIYVLARGELRRILIKALRQEHKYRRKKGYKHMQGNKGKIADMLSIEERPAEVALRSVPGHWEGDMILGKHRKSALGTLVERTTRYTLLVPLGKNKSALSVRRAYARAFRSVPTELKKTLTYDQGKEMLGHKRFTIDTGITVYFAHPGSPWERGTNENTNGLVRQYFPKGTDFSKISRYQIKRAQRRLNDRPRAVLNYEKPDELINRLVALKV
jgi:IS30 family transposase